MPKQPSQRARHHLEEEEEEDEHYHAHHRQNPDHRPHRLLGTGTCRRCRGRHHPRTSRPRPPLVRSPPTATHVHDVRTHMRNPREDTRAARLGTVEAGERRRRDEEAKEGGAAVDDHAQGLPGRAYENLRKELTKTPLLHVACTS